MPDRHFFISFLHVEKQPFFYKTIKSLSPGIPISTFCIVSKYINPTYLIKISFETFGMYISLQHESKIGENIYCDNMEWIHFISNFGQASDIQSTYIRRLFRRFNGLTQLAKNGKIVEKRMVALMYSETLQNGSKYVDFIVSITLFIILALYCA